VPVWLYQGALQRVGQECGPTNDIVCAVQFVDSTANADARGAGMSAPTPRASARQGLAKTSNQSHTAMKLGMDLGFYQNALCVSWRELLSFNSREKAGVVQTFPNWF
jgi:hypothetical protein